MASGGPSGSGAGVGAKTLAGPVQLSDEALVQMTQQILAGNKRPPQKIKIPDADEFRGDPTHIRTWIQQCESKFTQYEEANDSQKVIYASNKLKGPAAQWILPALENNTFSTWEEFKKGFKEAFGEPDTKEAAKIRIKALRQITSVNDYWTRFSTDMNLLEWNEEALKSEFYDGLAREIRDRLTNILDKPTGLNEFAHLCIKLDNEINASRRRITKFGQSNFQPRIPAYQPLHPRNTNGTFAPNSTPATELPPGDPMDLDATRKPRFQRLTEGERARRSRLGLCFYCAQRGHMANRCPTKRNLNSPSSRKTGTYKANEITTEEEEIPNQSQEPAENPQGLA